MIEAHMTPDERYWVLAHAATRPGANLEDPRVSSGAILLALRESDGVSRFIPEATFGGSLAEADWVDRLCLSPGNGRLRRLLGEISSSAADKTGVPLVRRRGVVGLIRGTQELDRSHPSFLPAARECLNWLSGSGDSSGAALRMLELAGALRALSRIDAEAVHAALDSNRGSAGWRSCDGVVSLVENAGFMSATLTGAL